MRFLIPLAAGLCALSGMADALTGQAIAMRDGPLSSGRFVGPIWMMQCPDRQRLVGLRVHEDSRVASIEAICAELTMILGDVVWTARPNVLRQPRIRRSDEPVSYVADKGVEVEPDSYDDRYAGAGYERRFYDGDADRIVITATQAPENGPDVWERPDDGEGNGLPGETGASLQQAAYAPDEPPPADAAPDDGSDENPYELQYARDTWESTPYVWRYDGRRYRGAVVFEKVRGSYDIVCPADRFVSGLRAGWRKAKGRDQIASLQLVCSGGGERRDRVLVGDWPTSRLAKKGRAAPSLRVERLECGASSANPHDGQVVRSVFGAIEAGRLQTVGISCSRDLDPAPILTRLGKRLTAWLRAEVAPMLADRQLASAAELETARSSKTTSRRSD